MTPEEYKNATPEQKAALRKREAAEFARRIMESRGISVEEHARRLTRDKEERAAILRNNGDEEEDEG